MPERRCCGRLLAEAPADPAELLQAGEASEALGDVAAAAAQYDAAIAAVARLAPRVHAELGQVFACSYLHITAN